MRKTRRTSPIRRSKLSVIKGDELLEFPLHIIFPPSDPLARYILRLMQASFDLQTILELRNELPRRTLHPVSTLKRGGRELFLLRMYMGFLQNARRDIIENTPQRGFSLRSLIEDMGAQTQDIFQRLQNAFKQGLASKYLARFRNTAAFHYHDQPVASSLRGLGPGFRGKIIWNKRVKDVHFAVANSVTDYAAVGGSISPDQVRAILGDAEHVEDLLQAFTVKLFDDYVMRRSVAQRISSQRY